MDKDVWEEFFRNFNRRFDSFFSGFTPAGNVKTYGYTMYQGPDGVPHVREFGNAVGEYSPRTLGVAREPLTDVTRVGDDISVVVELPGVEKEDIVLEGGKNFISVSVDTEGKKFSKTVALPCDAEADSAEAEYNNGILEIRVKAADPGPERKRIDIK
ncbi:MAG: Hsp20/alpha crystallin family protein [Thermoplasmatales archaeon]|nr:Hsp20/alpha crystallin family protein [Thermoplasmatales archaeon]